MKRLLKDIIEESIKKIQQRGEVFTPAVYYRVFIETALEKGLSEGHLHRLLYGYVDIDADEIEAFHRISLEVIDSMSYTANKLKKDIGSANYILDKKEVKVDLTKEIVDEVDKIKHTNSVLLDGFDKLLKVIEDYEKVVSSLDIDRHGRDELTGFLKGDFVFRIAGEFLYNFSRYSTIFSVLLIEMFNLEEYVSKGDLKLFSSKMKKSLRRSDIVVKMDNDSFVIFLCETGYDKAFVVLNKLLNVLKESVSDDIYHKLKVKGSVTEVKSGDTWDRILDRLLKQQLVPERAG